MTDAFDMEEPRPQPRGHRGQRQRKGATNFNREGSRFGKVGSLIVHHRVPSTGHQATSLKPDDASPKFICLVDLEPHHCRWPYGESPDVRSCGHQKKIGSSYCIYHDRRSRA